MGNDQRDANAADSEELLELGKDMVFDEVVEAGEFRENVPGDPMFLQHYLEGDLEVHLLYLLREIASGQPTEFVAVMQQAEFHRESGERRHELPPPARTVFWSKPRSENVVEFMLARGEVMSRLCLSMLSSRCKSRSARFPP